MLDTTDGPANDLIGLRECIPRVEHYQDLLRLMWYLRSPRQHAVTVFYVPAQHGHTWNERKCLIDVISLASLADVVILVISETVSISSIIDELTVLNNVIVMTPGQHNHGPGRRPFVCWQHWIQDLSRSWQSAEIREKLSQASEITQREYCFEAMLGGERPYRTWLHDWISKDAAMSGSTLMSYYANTGSSGYLLEPEIEIDQWPEPMHTGSVVDYHGVPMRLACVPPVSVYQRSWFTVLAETSAHGAWNFFTEKVAKPLLAQRLFLVLGGQHYLRGLRESGFRTFHGVIDESYDLEPDDHVRARMVFEEMRRIQQRDPVQIMRDTRWEREHNQRVAQKQNWMADAALACTQIAESIIKSR